MGIFAYIKADCDIILDRANLQEDDIPGNIYLNLTDSRIESKYSYIYVSIWDFFDPTQPQQPMICRRVNFFGGKRVWMYIM